MNERIFIAAQALLNDIEAMQNKENKDWFDGFTAWEMTGDEESETDRMSFEWPNLAISADRLKDAIKEITDLRAAQQEVEIMDITMKMVQK